MKWLSLFKTDKVRTPVIYGLLATGLAALISYWDQFQLEQWLPEIVLTRVDLGRNILSAIATSLLTMSTITFSVMTMAMNTYASQYSPRTLPNFYSDPVTIRAKSLFLAGFLYAILGLLLLKYKPQEQFVLAPAIAVLVAVFIVGYFMYFIQYVSQMTHVNNLLSRLAQDAVKAMEDLRQKAAVSARDWPLPPKDAFTVPSPDAGYVQHANTKLIVKLAARHNLTVELLPQIGDYVIKQTPYLRVWGMEAMPIRDKDRALSKLLQAIPLGKGRSNQDDMEYTVQKISEIALRAISPSTNDPNTAIYCVRELGRVLTKFGNGRQGTVFFQKETGPVRFVMYLPTFERMIYKTFYQIIHYARQDVSVMSEILNTLGFMHKFTNEPVRGIVAEFGQYVVASMDRKVLVKEDCDYWLEKVAALEEETGRKYA